MTHTTLDALRYAVANTEQTVDWVTDRMYDLPDATVETDGPIDMLSGGLSQLVKELKKGLAPHVRGREDWYRYSDGRPMETTVNVRDRLIISHLWHPDPQHEPPATRTTYIGAEEDGVKVTVEYELPSKIRVTDTDGRVIAESGRGNAETLLSLVREPADESSRRLVQQVEDVTALGADPELSPSIDQMKAYIEHITERRESQPDRLFDLRGKLLVARDEALQAEPWGMFIKEIQGYTQDGEPSAVLTFPDVAAKEMFGVRLALELASQAGSESDVQETLNDYFTWIKEPGHLFLVFSAALESMATMILPAMFEIVEDKACDYDTRTNFLATAVHSWEQRLASFGGPSAEGVDGA
ncbi:hypothetical protein [Rhodococcus sp. MEB064]|uniref:hypothetical protein n=1 Tax=Rhodococcus sp. MEB064 TaxID=1587522 RepID=UPI0005ABFD1D|nr:hypothetical protein [Rhodococcus sp. MEB064]KIQ15326.1 hypothetical protein RU01_15405 [Rhodococcus sp. MEB064]